MTKIWSPWLAAAGLAAAIAVAAPAYAELSAEELAKLAQNPVGNLISLPFQNNTNLNFGPENVGVRLVCRHSLALAK